MKRISFSPQFVNETGNDLIPGKIHTIRQNYDYWKKFEGQDVALFTWEGKPYQHQSRQKVFCVKRLVYVQKITKAWHKKSHSYYWYINKNGETYYPYLARLAINDGLAFDEFEKWFYEYPDGDMAILHFTDFRY
jgi:hypothetical protein